jgi:hypothetical protein
VEVVLLVAGLVVVKEHLVGAGPRDRPPGVPGDRAVGHPAAVARRGVEQVELVAAALVVVDRDPLPVGSDPRVVEGRETGQRLERVVDGVERHRPGLGAASA